MPRKLEIFLPLDEDEAALPQLVARAGGIPVTELTAGPGELETSGSLRVLRRSLDARKGHPIGWRVDVFVRRAGEPHMVDSSRMPPPRRRTAGRSGGPMRVVVVGSGPAGTFAAWRLASAGIAATVVERGKPVQPRRHDLASLVARGQLAPDSNYCFGEGGAGTFSDGKLYTRTKDRRAVAEVLRILTEHGADPDIEVDSRPHIGSNRLPKILVAMRNDLEARGVRYVWSDPVVDLVAGAGADRGRIAAVRLRSGEELPADAVVLAVGHSARPIYELCVQRSIAIEARPFAVGARVEHPQPMIDRQQYGRAAGHPKLPPAFYHVTAHVPAMVPPGAVAGAEVAASGERGVYSFCMCPGGWVVASATEEGALCVNGMSLKRRDSPFANSALVVTVEPRDFELFGGGSARGPSAKSSFGVLSGALAGIDFQRRLEEAAYAAGGGGFIAPSQRVDDFLAGRATKSPLSSSYRPGIAPSRLDQMLPGFITEALRRALSRFDRMLPGFAGESGQLVGVETRTSAPVRILRDPNSLQSPSLAGLYPAGEGAGYAGGIVSAAIDGLRIADAILAD